MNGQDKWLVQFQCRNCATIWILEYAGQMTAAEIMDLYPPERQEKFCPFCQGGKAELQSIKMHIVFHPISYK